jgi:hypothetical protein
MMMRPMVTPLAPPGPPDPPLEPTQIVALAPQLLSPPLEAWDEGTFEALPGVRGGYGGRRATLRLRKVMQTHGRNSFDVEVEGPTAGVTCSVSAPAVFRSNPLTGDAEFDALYEVYSVPAAVGPLLFGPELRALMKAARPAGLRVENDRVHLGNSAAPRPLAQVAAQLAVAAMILDRLPEAMRAAGGVPGVPHPEVVQHRRRSTGLRVALVVLLAVLILGPLLLLGVCGGAYYLWGSSPAEEVTAPAGRAPAVRRAAPAPAVRRAAPARAPRPGPSAPTGRSPRGAPPPP